MEGLLQGLTRKTQGRPRHRQGERPVRGGQEPHEGRGARQHALEAAEEHLVHQVLFGLEPEPSPGCQAPAALLVAQAAVLLGELQEVLEEPRIAQGVAEEVRDGEGRELMGAQEVLQHAAQVVILEAVEVDDRGGRVAPEVGEEGAQARAPGAAVGGQEPGGAGPVHQLAERGEGLALRAVQTEHGHEARAEIRGEGQGLQGRGDLLGVQHFLAPGPAARHEGVGGHPAAEGAGRAGALGVELGLEPLEHRGGDASEEDRGRLRLGLEPVDEEAVCLGGGEGERRHLGLADALLALEQDDALHGRGGAEAQHQGLEVGGLLAPAPQGTGEILAEIRRLLPGQGLGAVARGAFKSCLEALEPPGGLPEHPGEDDAPRAQVDRFGMEEGRSPEPGQAPLQLPHRLAPLGLRPAGPGPGEGLPVKALHVPDLVLVESEPRLQRLDRVGPLDAAQELGLELFKAPVVGTGMQPLEQVPRAALLLAQQVPGTGPRASEVQERFQGRSAREPDQVHGDRAGPDEKAEDRGGMRGSLAEGPRRQSDLQGQDSARFCAENSV